MIAACDVEVMTTNHELAKQIEDIVRQHVDVLRASASAAVAHAFSAVSHVPTRVMRASTQTKPVRTRKQAPRRAPEELVALADRFHAVLCQRPGETMTMLAPQVGVAPRVLQVAVARLRRDGRVRAIGKRQHTRYYPMAGSPSAITVTTAAAA